MRRTALFALVLCTTAVCGCAWLPGAKKRKIAEAERQLVASRRAPAPVGRVALFNEGEGFALIEAAGTQSPPPGTELRVYRAGGVVAELRATGVRRRPFLVADLVTGVPIRGDVVLRAGVQEETPKAQEAAQPSTEKKRPWWNFWSGLFRRGH